MYGNNSYLWSQDPQNDTFYKNIVQQELKTNFYNGYDTLCNPYRFAIVG